MADADTQLTAPATIAAMSTRARAAAAVLAGTSDAAKAGALRSAATVIRAAAPAILAANAEDMKRARAAGLSGALLDRLLLDDRRVAAMADGVAAVADLADPVGQVIDSTTRPNGLELSRVRVPIGVIGIVYESRPNVTADAAALCVRSGNAVILRGGSEASASNRAIHAAFAEGLASGGLPVAAVQLVASTDRALVGAMLKAAGLIDLIVPRGGKGLVARVQEEARVPVLAHLDGINHVYVHASADPTMAERIVLDAKLRRTGICGAMETLLIDRGFGEPERLVRALLTNGCEVRGDAAVQALERAVLPASDEDWDTEYLDAIASVAMVDGLDAALGHIARHGSHHTDAIVAEDAAVAERFLGQVDSAIVLWNASTQFADGGEFGLGAEIGIATGRLHARGPVALEGLTTYKWLGRGNRAGARVSDPAIYAFRRRDARVTTSGQPTELQVAALLDMGARHVINLGLHSHERALPDERASVEALGMTYTYVPVDFAAPTEEDFAAFAAALATVGDDPVHVHCIANMRVTAFFYRYDRDVLGLDGGEARRMMNSVWQPGGVWAGFIGDDAGVALEHRGPVES